jgi:uncharacterized protein YdaU (DUF1376 family)
MDWFPWFYELYAADTRHLSCLEHGAYRQLIDEYMRYRRPLAADDQALARIVGLSTEEWGRISGTIRPFFRKRRGKLFHKRCNAILDQQDKKAKTRSETARKGGLARQLKSREKTAGGKLAASSQQADAQPNSAIGEERRREETEIRSTILRFPEPSSPPHKPPLGCVKGSGKYPVEFDAFWRAYPSRSPHSNPKKTALAKFEAAIKGGTSPDIIIAGTLRFAKYVASEKTDPRYIPLAATWLNQERWTDLYEPRVGAAQMPMAFEG